MRFHYKVRSFEYLSTLTLFEYLNTLTLFRNLTALYLFIKFAHSKLLIYSFVLISHYTHFLINCTLFLIKFTPFPSVPNALDLPNFHSFPSLCFFGLWTKRAQIRADLHEKSNGVSEANVMRFWMQRSEKRIYEKVERSEIFE